MSAAPLIAEVGVSVRGCVLLISVMTMDGRRVDLRITAERAVQLASDIRALVKRMGWG